MAKTTKFIDRTKSVFLCCARYEHANPECTVKGDVTEQSLAVFEQLGSGLVSLHWGDSCHMADHDNAKRCSVLRSVSGSCSFADLVLK